jgi:hypothetical protein
MLKEFITRKKQGIKNVMRYESKEDVTWDWKSDLK